MGSCSLLIFFYRDRVGGGPSGSETDLNLSRPEKVVLCYGYAFFV